MIPCFSMNPVEGSGSSKNVTETTGEKPLEIKSVPDNFYSSENANLVFVRMSVHFVLFPDTYKALISSVMNLHYAFSYIFYSIFSVRSEWGSAVLLQVPYFCHRQFLKGKEGSVVVWLYCVALCKTASGVPISHCKRTPTFLTQQAPLKWKKSPSFHGTFDSLSTPSY